MIAEIVRSISGGGRSVARVRPHAYLARWNIPAGARVLATDHMGRMLTGRCASVAADDGSAMLRFESDLGEASAVADGEPIARALLDISAIEWTEDIDVLADGTQRWGGTQTVSPAGGVWWPGDRARKGDLVRLTGAGKTIDFQLRADATLEATLSCVPLLRGVWRARLARKVAA